MQADAELVGAALDAVGHGGLDRVAFGEEESSYSTPSCRRAR